MEQEFAQNDQVQVVYMLIEGKARAVMRHHYENLTLAQKNLEPFCKELVN